MSIDEKRYEFVTAQCRYCNEKIIESFNLFIKLVTGIVGGMIFLDLNLAVNDPKRGTYLNASTVLIVLIGVSTLFQVWRYQISWWGYRIAEIKITAEAPALRKWWSRSSEISMTIAVIATPLCFWYFNPLR